MDVAGDEYTRHGALALGPQLALTRERQGELFFNDADLCFQQWQSCASCHPDGRADALNWDLLNDGMGNPKNTKSMVLSHVTPPSMVSGIRDSAETAVRAGIRHIQFAVRPEEDAEAIDAYLKSLEPVPSPTLENGTLSESAKRGEGVFDRAGCARCHSGPYFTNLKSYDVGTGAGREAGKAFDTPTLVELWRTGPFLHDGRAATIEAILTICNPDDQHGATSGLTPEEIEDLSAFLSSISTPNETKDVASR
jgi:cytochrome c peroxidase